MVQLNELDIKGVRSRKIELYLQELEVTAEANRDDGCQFLLGIQILNVFVTLSDFEDEEGKSMSSVCGSRRKAKTMNL